MMVCLLNLRTVLQLGAAIVTPFGQLRKAIPVAVMEPEKRVYLVQKMPMTEAAIDPGLFRDLFVALGEPLGNEGAWSVRIYHKPFIRWIWLGALIMAFGGLLAAMDPRYRQLARRRSPGTETIAEAVS